MSITGVSPGSGGFNTSPPSLKRNIPARIITGGGGYRISGGAASAANQNAPGFGEFSWEAQALAPAYPYTIALSKVETTAYAGTSVPSLLQVLTTTNTSQLSTAIMNMVSSITVEQTTPGTSTIYYAWSFDGRVTWWTYQTDAWVNIVKEDGGVWKYLNGADPRVWTAASIDNMYQALREGFAIAVNQMTGTEVNAMTTAMWEDTDGIIPSVTQTVDVALGLTAGSSLEKPYCSSITMKYTDEGTTTIDGWINGQWSPLTWTDGTEVADIPWAQSGVITGTETTLDYSVQSGVPGYFLRVRTNGTGPQTTLSRILYKGPCQPLANIGDGQPNTVNGFIYVDTSTNAIVDHTTTVSDNTLSNFSVATIPMASDDYVYIGYYDQFNCIEMTIGEDNNQVSSTLAVEYWSGSTWVELDIEDTTAGETTMTLSTTGRISWTLPDDWKQNIPFDAFLSRAYWVRLSVSVALTSTTAVAECRVYSVPTALKKHRFAAVAGDKVFIANRPDAADQVDVSRPLEEYGFTGDASGSFRVGGKDAIVAVSAAYNTLFIWKPSSVHQFTGQGFEAAESAGRTPINQQCVVKATNQGKTGLFFLNRYGGFVISGLHTDSTWNTAAIAEVTGMLDWWDSNVTPRLDLNYLHNACGEYWPKKNWLVWSVPMILSGASQTTNNVLVVLDLNLMAWYPPFVYPFGISAMCTAYTNNVNAPQKLGDLIMLGGTYDGRIVRLFDPSATTDLGTAITCYAETGWLHHGNASEEKTVSGVWLFGTSAGNVTLTTTSRYNYRQSLEQPATSVRTFADLIGATNQLGMAKEAFSASDHGNYFKYRLDWTGQTSIYGLTLEIEPERSE